MHEAPVQTQSQGRAGAGDSAGRARTPARRAAAPGRAVVPVAGIAGPCVVRRTVHAKFVAGPGETVADLVLSGRTPSPHGRTMGAHTTAWTVHLDAIRRTLIGLPIREAAQALSDLATKEAITGGGTGHRLFAFADEAQKQQLALARVAVSGAAIQVDLAKVGGGDPLVAAMRSLVDAYLTYLNYLPGGTVAGVKTTGNAEGRPRTLLNLFEYHRDAPGLTGDTLLAGLAAGGFGFATTDEVRAALRQAGARLYDANAAAAFAGAAVDQPGAAARQQALEATHEEEFARAYPSSYAFIHGNERTGRAARTGESDKTGRTSTFLATGTADALGVVTGLTTDGRTQSPFAGEMGSHTTAWVVHLEGVRRLVVGRTVAAALVALRDRGVALGTDPRRRFVPSMDDEHRARLEVADRDLAALAVLAVQPNPTVGDLESYIACYLSVVNLLPGSTLRAEVAAGRGEAGNHDGLRQLEDHLAAMSVTDRGSWAVRNPDRVREAREAIARLFDDSAMEFIEQDGLAGVLTGRHRHAITEAYPLVAEHADVTQVTDQRLLLGRDGYDPTTHHDVDDEDEDAEFERQKRAKKRKAAMARTASPKTKSRVVVDGGKVKVARKKSAPRKAATTSRKAKGGSLQPKPLPKPHVELKKKTPTKQKATTGRSKGR